jgi:hypothetical protein
MLNRSNSLWRGTRINRGPAMSQFEAADNTIASGTKSAMSAYVPPLQRTEGQPPPIAAMIW